MYSRKKFTVKEEKRKKIKFAEGSIGWVSPRPVILLYCGYHI
jgi:hypothetical protein